jgi:hypothetical protein
VQHAQDQDQEQGAHKLQEREKNYRAEQRKKNPVPKISTTALQRMWYLGTQMPQSTTCGVHEGKTWIEDW